MTEPRKPPITAGDLVALAFALAPMAVAAYRSRGVPLEATVTYTTAKVFRAVAATAGRFAITAENAYWRCVNRGN